MRAAQGTAAPRRSGKPTGRWFFFGLLGIVLWWLAGAVLTPRLNGRPLPYSHLQDLAQLEKVQEEAWDLHRELARTIVEQQVADWLVATPEYERRFWVLHERCETLLGRRFEQGMEAYRLAVRTACGGGGLAGAVPEVGKVIAAAQQGTAAGGPADVAEQRVGALARLERVGDMLEQSAAALRRYRVVLAR